jgi:predicted DNA binding protein
MAIMMEAVICVDMKDGWVKAVCEGTGRPIRILYCMPQPEGGGRSLFEIEAEEAELEGLREQINSHPDVQKVQLTATGGGRAKGSLVTKKCFACQTIMESDCFLRSAQTNEDGTVEWDVILASDGSLAREASRHGLQGQGIEGLPGGGRCRHDPEAGGEIVRKAFEMGHYDYPKRTTIRDMAIVLKVAPSTLTEILQRGERNIIERHLRDGK